MYKKDWESWLIWYTWLLFMKCQNQILGFMPNVLIFLWFSSEPPGECHDSSLKQAACISSQPFKFTDMTNRTYTCLLLFAQISMIMGYTRTVTITEVERHVSKFGWCVCWTWQPDWTFSSDGGLCAIRRESFSDNIFQRNYNNSVIQGAICICRQRRNSDPLHWQ